MYKVEDFSDIQCTDDIATTTITNSNKAVKQNLGIYKRKTSDGIKLRTGRYCGITWLRAKGGGYKQDSEGRKQQLVVIPRFGLNIDMMIQKIAIDEEFFDYLCDDQPEGDRMFTFFFDEEMMEVKDDDKICDNRLMVAMSFIHLLYMETRRSLMKKIIHKENNFTGKVKGKILFNKQIQKNLVQGHEERIYCGYVQKSEDIFENQILKYALVQAKEYLYSKKISNNQIMREIKACELRLINVSEVDEINPEEIDNIQLPAMYTNYDQVMKLAYLVIAQISMTSNFQNDSNKIVPYAVNMPLLFECYCRTLIKEQIIKVNNGWKMLKFVADKSGTYDEVEYGVRTIEGNYYISGKIVPDIVLNNGNENIVFDVKYKKFLWENDKLPKKPARRDDRLQLLAYNEVYQPIICGHICPAFFLKNSPLPLDVYWFNKKIEDDCIPYYMVSVSDGTCNIKGCLENGYN